MRSKALLAAAAIASVVGAATPAMSGAWPLYDYYGYDPAWGYYGSLSAAPSFFYVWPRAGYGGYAGPVCAWQPVKVGNRAQWVCR